MRSNCFMSPAAERLLRLLTPMPVPISARQAASPAVKELERLGLILVRLSWEDAAISLTPEGGRFTGVAN